MYKSKGFSLIELLIVMAIVGILSAIAIPAYKDYMIRTKIGVAMSFLEATALKSQQYMMQHGSFPDSVDIGLTAAYTDHQTNPANYVAPYIASVSANPGTTLGHCAAGSVSGLISNFDGPASDFSTTGKEVEVVLSMLDNGGVVSRFCYMIPHDFSGDPLTYNIPNCYDANTDFASYAAAINAAAADCNN